MLGKAAGKLNESLKTFRRGMEEQRRYQETEAAQSAAAAENKFGGDGYELTFGRQVQFYHGLEELIGQPVGGSAEALRQAMQREHCEMPDRHAQVYANPNPNPLTLTL